MNNISLFNQKLAMVIVGSVIAVLGGLVASLFRIDAFTGSDALEMERRILIRLSECREETRQDIKDLREAGRYHIERLDDHLENHGADND